MVALPGFNTPGRTPASAALLAVGALLLLAGLAVHGSRVSGGLYLGFSTCKPPTPSKPRQPQPQPPPECTPAGWRHPGWYTPRLPPDALLRALSYNGAAPRLHRFAQKLLRGQPVSIAALGGSITSGQGGGSTPYVDTFYKWLNATFPNPGHKLTNAGMGGANSMLFSFCADGFVPEDVDLVFIETAYNEELVKTYDPYSMWPYELMLRSLLSMPSKPAVLLFHAYSWPFDQWGLKPGELYSLPGTYSNSVEDYHTILAKYYELPEVSLRGAIFHLIRQNAPGFEGDIDTTMTKTLFSDNVHPSPAGHLLMADLLIRAVWHTVQCLDPCVAPRLLGCAARPAGSGPGGDMSRGAGRAGVSVGRISKQAASGWAELRGTLPPHEASGGVAEGPLPPAMVFREAGPGGELYRCVMDRAFEALGRSPPGNFTYQPHKPGAATFALQKWTWTGTQPGAWVEFRLNTADAAAQAPWPAGEPAEQQQQQHQAGVQSETSGEPVPAAPPATGKVAFGVMLSYESMGMASVTCVSGCTCEPTTTDGTWWRPTTEVRMHVQHVSRHPRCVLRITILAETKSNGHKIQLKMLSVA